MTPKLFIACILTFLGIGATSALPIGGSPAAVGAPAATTSLARGCESHTNPQGIRLWMHVVQWCAIPAVRHQAQFKLQMKIHNQSDEHSLDISQDHIRLIVSEFDPDRWSPPLLGSPTTDRPVQTTYLGDRVWAVPANADGAYDTIPNHPQVLTFATHWGRSNLDPGETFHPAYHYGDLVFYVPTPRHGTGAMENVVGVAYVKSREIIALCPPESWGPHVPAASF